MPVRVRLTQVRALLASTLQGGKNEASIQLVSGDPSCRKEEQMAEIGPKRKVFSVITFSVKRRSDKGKCFIFQPNTEKLANVFGTENKRVGEREDG